MSVIRSRPLTPDDLLAMPDGKSCELVNGELVEKNVGVLSGRVETIVARRLDEFCEAAQAGPVFTGTTGIRCFFADDPARVRKPDAFFVKKERFEKSFWQDGFLTIHPDLAAEVVSPNDRATEIAEKVEEYLTAGVSLVWVIDPEVTVVIHRANHSVSKLYSDDELTGDDVLPGFRCRVRELFPRTDA